MGGISESPGPCSRTTDTKSSSIVSADSGLSASTSIRTEKPGHVIVQFFENARSATVSFTLNVLVTAFGETKPLFLWLSDPRCVVKHQMTLRSRIKMGRMTPE
jgi:hypothetical protein